MRTRRGSSLRVVDLFSGCGGLSIGLAEAARALEPVVRAGAGGRRRPGRRRHLRRQLPHRRHAAQRRRPRCCPARSAARLTSAERLLAKHHADIDVLVGGPPCQGHSDFNNRTRHADDKNELYRTMVRAAEVLEPQHILIENVPGALNDRRAVVQRTADALGELGYQVVDRRDRTSATSACRSAAAGWS